MADVDSLSPLKPGDRAPDFTVPLVDRDRTVALADYRGKVPLLLGLFAEPTAPSAGGRLSAWARLGSGSRLNVLRRWRSSPPLQITPVCTSASTLQGCQWRARPESGPTPPARVRGAR